MEATSTCRPVLWPQLGPATGALHGVGIGRNVIRRARLSSRHPGRAGWGRAPNVHRISSVVRRDHDMGVVRGSERVRALELGGTQQLLRSMMSFYLAADEQRRKYKYAAGQHTDFDSGPESILLHDTNGNYPDLDVKRDGGPGTEAGIRHRGRCPGPGELRSRKLTAGSLKSQTAELLHSAPRIGRRDPCSKRPDFCPRPEVGARVTWTFRAGSSARSAIPIAGTAAGRRSESCRHGPARLSVRPRALTR